MLRHSSRRISARAEEPVSRRRQIARQRAHLRASGGTTGRPPKKPLAEGASPRERRNLCTAGRLPGPGRRISARAEEPAAVASDARALEAHLRASGGTTGEFLSMHVNEGASPRERRNR